MRPTNKLLFCLLIILLLLCGAPAVDAQTAPMVPLAPDFFTAEAVKPLTPDFLTAEPAICSVVGESYSRSITTPDEVDVYSLELVADQMLTIDVTTADIGKSLDTILFVYFDSDPTDDIYPDIPIAWNDVSSEIPPDINNDPYLEITAEADGRYYLVIYDALNDGTTGDYTLSLKCTDSSTPPDPFDPLNVGDLLGSTSSDPGSLVVINPVDGTSTVRFSSVTGPIADIEYQNSTQSLLVAINNNPGAIITIDPDTGEESPVLKVDSGAVVALEDAAGVLYGVHVLINEFSFEPPLYRLVSINQATGELEFLASLGQEPITALAYHAAEKTMYGVATGSGGAELIKIDLTSFEAMTVGPTGLGQVTALDFSNDNVLYGVDVSGTLFSIPELATGKAVEIASLDISTQAITPASPAAPAGISGLTFVVGKPPDDDPVITSCSSTLTMPLTAAAEIDGRKLFGFKLKRHHKHHAVAFFKFQATAGESVTIRLAVDEKIFTEAEKNSSEYKLWKHMSKSKHKERAFLGLRDAIPGVKVKEKTKGRLPLELTVEDLPADGWYYIMVVQPLFRFHKIGYLVDYHVTLESDDPAGQACQTLEVAWPSDDAEKDFAATDESPDDTCDED